MSEQSRGATATAGPDANALLRDEALAGSWVLDPAGSVVEFHVRHFWGAVTVHGSFAVLAGEGSVAPGGAASGVITIEAASLTTKNKQRDKHLRSADFFDVEHHPQVVVTVDQLSPAGQASPDSLTCRGTLEAAGHTEPVQFTAQIDQAAAGSVVLRAELLVDRTKFGMTWSPLGMAAATARATVSARFVRP